MSRNRSNNTKALGGLYHWLFQDTMEGLRRRRAALGYLFLLPILLGIFVFTAGPVFVSFGLSLFRWNIFRPPDFIGLDNFERLLADRRVIIGLGNTLKFTILAVGSQVSLGLILALAVHRINRIWLRYYFRTAYFLPLLMSGASVAVFMGYIFHKEFGPLNYYLTLLGLPQVPWLTNSDLVMISIAIISAWRNLGFTFLIFLGGLSNLSQEVLDAADVDGAQGLRRLWSVVIPLLSPQILFATVTGVIGALQVFDEPYIMTRGGPGNASRTLVMVMYEHAFKDIEFGYGSAIAIVVFLMILIMSIVQMWLWRNRVFYQ